jgi:hypothetical protein
VEIADSVDLARIVPAGIREGPFAQPLVDATERFFAQKGTILALVILKQYEPVIFFRLDVCISLHILRDDRAEDGIAT